MLKEFMEYIAVLAIKANSATVLKPPSEPRHIYYVCTPDGDHCRVEAEPEPRQHHAGTLQTVLDFAHRFAAECTVCAWYSRTGVVAVIDDEKRRDQVKLPLDFSPQVKTLASLESSARTFKQPEFRKLLRVTFADCLERCPTLLGTVERVKFRVGSQTEAAVGHGKSSIGRQLESEVSGTASIPEYVELTVPVFAGGFPQLTAVVRCALEPDAGTESFQLVPLPRQIEDGITRAEDAIGVMLRESLGESAYVYHGQP